MSRKSNNRGFKQRMLESDMDIGPIMNGISDEQTARRWLGVANRINASQRQKRQIVDRIEELKSE